MRALTHLVYQGGGMTKINDYKLPPESELNEELLKEPLTRDNYKEKFHTLLCYEEHEHVRVLKERLTICVYS